MLKLSNRKRLFRFAEVLFDTLDVATAEAFDFAAKLEILLYLFIIENSEAIDYRKGGASPIHNFGGVKVEVLFMRDSKNIPIAIIRKAIKARRR